MIVVFANNQVIVAPAGTDSEITTDPVPLNGADRATGILNWHYGFGGATPATDQTLTITGQVSNDGTTWIDAGTPVTTNDGSDAPKRAEDLSMQAAYIRYKFKWGISTGNTGAVCFDWHVQLDHQ